MNIKAYHTHYEIYPYELGDCVRLEKMLSLWNETYFKATPKFHYDENKKILYVPRGFSEEKLKTYLGVNYMSLHKEHSTKTKATYTMNTFPRNVLQLEAIRFIVGKEEYKYTSTDSQQVLSLGTGEGKTYCMISGLSLLETKCIIIVNIEDLKKQWIKSYTKMTNLAGPNIIDIKSSTMLDKLASMDSKHLRNHIVYVTTHATLRSYAKKNGWSSLDDIFTHLGIGVKIYDEAHLEYSNVLMIDYFTNTWKTFYLSATFGRSEEKDNRIFQEVFNEIHKFDKINDERREHVNYIQYIINTRPSYNQIINCQGIKGFSSDNYMKYIVGNDIYMNTLREILQLFTKDNLEGRMIILSSKTETCDYITTLLEEEFPHKKSASHHSKHKVSNLEDYDIICATPKMLGTALDISGLRFMIVLEPYRSKVTTEQVFGRLREYDETNDTYYIEIIDKGFKSIVNMYNFRKKIITALNQFKKSLVLDKTKKK